MNGGDTDALLCEVARDIIADIAPGELPIFPAVSRAYLADPADALRRRRGAEAALGFGAEALSALMTMAVMYVLSEVLKTMLEAAKQVVADTVAKEATAMIKAMFKRFRQPGEPSPVPALEEAQLATVRDRIASAARDLQLGDEKTAILIKAVTARLAITE